MSFGIKNILLCSAMLMAVCAPTVAANSSVEACGEVTSVVAEQPSQQGGSVIVIENGILKRFSAAVRSFNIPYGVTAIAEGAFQDCTTLTKVAIPSSVTYIGDYAFKGCANMEELEIPSSVEYIGIEAFTGCGGNITLHRNIPDYNFDEDSKGAHGCFAGALVRSVTLGEGVTSVGDYAFYNCETLESVTLPTTLRTIGERAFFGCSSLTKVEFPSGVESLGEWAFTGCSSLTELSLGEKLEEIKAWTFHDCSSLTNLVIPQSVRSIGDYAFSNCDALESTTLGGMDAIGVQAFFGCTGELTVLGDVPGGVLPDLGAFADSEFTAVHIGSDVLTLGEFAFHNCRSIGAVYVDSLQHWFELEFLNGEANPLHWAQEFYVGGEQLVDVVVPSGVGEIGKYTFYKSSSLMSVAIPDGVTVVGNEAFRGCFKLEKVSLGGDLRVIGDSAFQDCEALGEVTLNDGLIAIGGSAFKGCSGLGGVVVPNGVELLGDYAFAECKSMKKAELPESLLGAGKYLFSSCEELVECNIPTSIVAIPEGMFRGCAKIEKIELHDGVSDIQKEAFKGCSGMKELVLPNGLKRLGREAFAECGALESVTLGIHMLAVWSDAYPNYRNKLVMKNTEVPIDEDFKIEVEPVLSASNTVNTLNGIAMVDSDGNISQVETPAADNHSGAEEVTPSDGSNEVVATSAATEESAPVVEEKEEPYIRVADMPKFKGGGLEKFLRWVVKEFEVPFLAQESGIGGKVVVRFVVEKDGTLGDVEIMLAPDVVYHDAVKKLFRRSPLWVPGRHEGQIVRVCRVISFDGKV